MDLGQFMLLLLSAAGLFVIVNFLLGLMRRLILLLRRITANFSPEGVINELYEAYDQENEVRVRSASIRLAYKKLFELQKTRKSYRQRIADFRAVKESHLPMNDFLVYLLASAIPNQNDYELKFGILSYLLKVKENIRISQISFSVWLTELIFGGYLFYNKSLDLLSGAQLLALFLLALIAALLPAFIRNKNLKSNILVAAVPFTIIIIFFAMYSLIHHVYAETKSVEKSGVHIEYPIWVTTNFINLPILKSKCGTDLIIKSPNKGPVQQVLPAMQISSDAKLIVLNEKCNTPYQQGLPQGMTLPEEAVIYRLELKNKIPFFDKQKARVGIVILKSDSYPASFFSFVTNIENPAWAISRWLAFSMLIPILLGLFSDKYRELVKLGLFGENL